MLAGPCTHVAALGRDRLSRWHGGLSLVAPTEPERGAMLASAIDAGSASTEQCPPTPGRSKRPFVFTHASRGRTIALRSVFDTCGRMIGAIRHPAAHNSEHRCTISVVPTSVVGGDSSPTCQTPHTRRLGRTDISATQPRATKWHAPAAAIDVFIRHARLERARRRAGKAPTRHGKIVRGRPLPWTSSFASCVSQTTTVYCATRT